MFLFYFQSCESLPPPAEPGGLELTAADVETLRSQSLPYPQDYSGPELKKYKDFYQLNHPGVTYKTGTMDSSAGEKIFTQTFALKPSGGTWVLLVHGYLEHTALNARAVKFFLDRGLSVAAIDLPGHGLSTGSRGYVTNFDIYGDGLSSLADLVRKNYSPDGLIASGHSTGGATIMNWILRTKPLDLKAVVLMAPLVRSYLWDISQAGLALISWAVDKVPNRPASDATSNPEFAKLLGSLDPMRVPFTDLTWAKSMTEWVKRITEYPGTLWNGPVLICQGEKDTIVDGTYNVEFLKKIFSGSQVEAFPTLKHTLFNEPGTEGQRVYTVVDDFLKKQGL